MTAVGLVLAAGRSRRFGAADKLLAPFRGAPLATHVARAMTAVPLDHRIAVVASPAVAALFPGFETVAAPTESGQGASLAAGVARARTLGADRVLVALADMPCVAPELLAAVLERSRIHGAAAATDGVRRMPPAAFAAAAFDTLAAMTGDRGAAALVATLPEAALVRAAPAALSDIDRPDDLALLAGASADPGGPS